MSDREEMLTRFNDHLETRADFRSLLAESHQLRVEVMLAHSVRDDLKREVEALRPEVAHLKAVVDAGEQLLAVLANPHLYPPGTADTRFEEYQKVRRDDAWEQRNDTT